MPHETTGRDDIGAIHPQARVGHVHLKVADLERAIGFYRTPASPRHATPGRAARCVSRWPRLPPPCAGTAVGEEPPGIDEGVPGRRGKAVVQGGRQVPDLARSVRRFPRAGSTRYVPKTDEWYADREQFHFATWEAVSPLHRLEAALHPWVAFVIMPVFALANAGVTLEVSGIGDPVAVAVAAGLAVGKPIGIVLFCWLAVSLGLTKFPDGVEWPLLVGGACLAGIGFTMALFINGPAFPVSEFPAKEVAGKVGTLLGSLVSAIPGAGILLTVMRKSRSAAG